jgi:hypothetical protein
LQECDKDIQSLMDTQNRSVNQVLDANNSCHSLEEKEKVILDKIESKINMRTQLGAEVIYLQKQIRRYSDLRDGKYVLAIKDISGRLAEIEKQKIKLEKLQEIESYLEVNFT